MDNKFSLLVSLIIFVSVTSYFILSQWRHPKPTTGLPLAMILLTALEHLPGAFIHVLPWYSNEDTYHTSLGFQETTYGMLAFAISFVIISPKFKGLIKPWLKVRPRIPDWTLPQAYCYMGLILTYLLLPVFWVIPSFQSLTSSGTWLIVVGLCLGCWRAYLLKQPQNFRLWLLITLCLPLLTVATGGYASYGSMMVVFTLSFVLVFSRPNGKTILTIVLVGLLGSSFFVNYYRDRGEIRGVVWGNQGWGSRIDVLSDTFANFEFLDITNPQHLQAINDRLNQNILVGEAIEYMGSGNIPFAQGETITSSFLAAIPRIIWRDKPSYIGGWNLVGKYTGKAGELAQTTSNTSIAAGLTFEFYVNYGTIGVIIGFFVLGLITKIIDLVASYRLLSGDWQGFMSWYLPGIGIIKYQADMAELISTTSALIVLVFILNRVRIPRFMKGKNARVGV